MNTILSKINTLPTLEVEFVHGLIEDAVSLEKVKEIIKNDQESNIIDDLESHIDWLKELRSNGHISINIETVITAVTNMLDRNNSHDRSLDYTFRFEPTNDTYMEHYSEISITPKTKIMQVIFFKESGKYYTTEDFKYKDVTSPDHSKKVYELVTQAEEFIRNYQKTHYKGMNAIIIFESDTDGYPIMIPADKEDN